MAKMKSFSAIQQHAGRQCSMPGCYEDITMFKGKGESVYCRKHQLGLVEHGGLGRSDRPYTLNKEWCCSKCGYDPRTDPRFDAMLDPVMRNQAQRATIIGDHKLRSHDHGTDSRENIQTLCYVCNAIKSAEAKDWSRPAMA